VSFQDSLVILVLLATIFGVFAAIAKEGSFSRRVWILALCVILLTTGVLVWHNYVGSRVTKERFSTPIPASVAAQSVVPLSSPPTSPAPTSRSFADDTRATPGNATSQLDPRLQAEIDRALNHDNAAGQLDPRLQAQIDRAFNRDNQSAPHGTFHFKITNDTSEVVHFQYRRVDHSWKDCEVHPGGYFVILSSEPQVTVRLGDSPTNPPSVVKTWTLEGLRFSHKISMGDPDVDLIPAHPFSTDENGWLTLR
jgi:hypothetical protein